MRDICFASLRTSLWSKSQTHAVYDSNSSHFGYEAKVRTKSESAEQVYDSTNIIWHTIDHATIVIPGPSIVFTRDAAHFTTQVTRDAAWNGKFEFPKVRSKLHTHAVQRDTRPKILHSNNKRNTRSLSDREMQRLATLCAAEIMLVTTLMIENVRQLGGHGKPLLCFCLRRNSFITVTRTAL